MRLSRGAAHAPNYVIVIPNPFAAGGRERELTSACTHDVVWQRRKLPYGAASFLTPYTPLPIQSHRKVPLPAFSQVRDDIALKCRGGLGTVFHSVILSEVDVREADDNAVEGPACPSVRATISRAHPQQHCSFLYCRESSVEPRLLPVQARL